MFKSMRKILLLLILGTTFTSFAQDHDTRLDSVLANQEIILANQQNYGFEFDPALAMVSLGIDEGVFLAGGFSMFNISRKAEIAIPFQFATDKNGGNFFEVGGQYRHFLGRHQKGFWIGAGLTFRNMNYESYGYYYGDYAPGYGSTREDERHSVQQVGINFGLGIRIFSAGGLYWGTSISVGRFFGEDALGYPNFGFVFNEKNLLFDFEILKFGYAF